MLIVSDDMFGGKNESLCWCVGMMTDRGMGVWGSRLLDLQVSAHHLGS